MNIFMRCKLWDVIFFPFCSFIPFIHLSLPSLSLVFSAFTHSFVHSLFFHSFLLHIHDEREWNGRIAGVSLEKPILMASDETSEGSNIVRNFLKKKYFSRGRRKERTFFPFLVFSSRLPNSLPLPHIISPLSLSLSFDSLPFSLHLFFGRNIKARFRPLRGDWVKFPSRSKGRESKKQREREVERREIQK